MLDKPAILEVGAGDENHVTSGRAKMPRIARLIVKEEEVGRGPLPDSETGNQNRELPHFLAIPYTDLPLTLPTCFAFYLDFRLLSRYIFAHGT